MVNSYALFVRRALILCAVAVPIVGLNIFASSQNNDAILYWSVASTLTATLFGSAFILWTANILWPITAAVLRPQSSG